MGVISGILNLLFGGGRNVLKDTAEVFRENSEAGAARDTTVRQAALAQFAQEFKLPKQGWFDRFMDGVNRLPRPMMAMACLGLFAAAMVDPVWFAARMQGISLVPEPLWWLLGIVVSFYFGARHQAKGQEFQQSIARTLARTPDVVSNIRALDTLKETTSSKPVEPNPALDAWQQTRDNKS